eukprot:m.162460 g.162460  ORF g.162460 m.162460 type:complete len:155 (+) comp23878_c0_seq6:581-1045(+)
MAGTDLCNGSITFWELPGHRYNETGWWTMVNTMDKASVHVNKGGKTGFLVPVVRPCLSSVETLLRRHGSKEFQNTALTNGKPDVFEIDFLLIDVECQDYRILQLIDWVVLRPRYIQYESLVCECADSLCCNVIIPACPPPPVLDRLHAVETQTH